MDASRIIKAVKTVTKKWSKQRKAEERQASAVYRRQAAMCRMQRVTIKEVAYEVMERAYKEAAGNVGLANPRQIYYAARPTILQRTGNDTLDSMYFCQTLLVNYMRENPKTTESWDICWDDRGHFIEPHTGKEIGLGTLAVREYLQRVGGGASDKLIAPSNAYPTIGPVNRFQAVLFIEKEGFLPIFAAARLAERFDLAIMASKGLSTTAARTLIDRLCGENKLPLLVLHDFDKSGFSILGTLKRNNRRYRFTNEVNVIDLGVRLDDVQEYDLESEPVTYGKSDPAPNLRENGATEEEIEFLCSSRDRGHYSGERVELNAYTSDVLIEWIEGKLKNNGVMKVIPDDATLERAYRRAAVISKLPKWVVAEAETVKVPAGLREKAQRALEAAPALSWDAAIAECARHDTHGDGGESVK
jgi:hypothetical protein